MRNFVGPERPVDELNTLHEVSAGLGNLFQQLYVLQYLLFPIQTGHSNGIGDSKHYKHKHSLTHLSF